ncbi:LOW QUALITY PROTEIN: sterol 26-hydroxylase, mitochondrial-like [Discoglossus pictus]
MHEASIPLERLPRWTMNILPYWDRFLGAWDVVFTFGKRLIDNKMKDIEDRLQKGEKVDGEYLTHLQSSGKLSLDEVYGSITELLQAGVDTTSNTRTWALYQLARNPDIQQSLYQEVAGVVLGDQIPSSSDIAKMPLLRAVIKEMSSEPECRDYGSHVCHWELCVGWSLLKDATKLQGFPGGVGYRIQCLVGKGFHNSPGEGWKMPRDQWSKHGVVPENLTKMIISASEVCDMASALSSTEFILCHYVLSHDEKNFPEPDRFLAECWLDVGMKHHLGSIPFGFGVRACMGRRITELEMHLALSRVNHLHMKDYCSDHTVGLFS